MPKLTAQTSQLRALLCKDMQCTWGANLHRKFETMKGLKRPPSCETLTVSSKLSCPWTSLKKILAQSSYSRMVRTGDQWLTHHGHKQNRSVHTLKERRRLWIFVHWCKEFHVFIYGGQCSLKLTRNHLLPLPKGAWEPSHHPQEYKDYFFSWKDRICKSNTNLGEIWRSQTCSLEHLTRQQWSKVQSCSTCQFD